MAKRAPKVDRSQILQGASLLLSAMGIPLVVSGFFSELAIFIFLGLGLLVLDLIFVPRSDYEEPLVELGKVSAVQKGWFLGFSGIVFVALFFLGAAPLFYRIWVVQQGRLAHGIVEEKFSPTQLPHCEFEVSYKTDSGERFTGRTYWVARKVYNQTAVGQPLLVRYVPDRPSWFVPADIPPENWKYYLPLLVSLAAFVFWYLLRVFLRV